MDNLGTCHNSHPSTLCDVRKTQSRIVWHNVPAYPLPCSNSPDRGVFSNRAMQTLQSRPHGAIISFVNKSMFLLYQYCKYKVFKGCSIN